MARGVAFTYVVHNTPIHAFVEEGGEVYNLIWKTSRDTGAIATNITAPRRTGRMANSIQANRPNSTSIFRTAARVWVKVGYGIYVHEGTDTIYPKSGGYLTIPREKQHKPNFSGGTLRKMWKDGQFKGQSKPFFTARSISGQKANPFLEEALHMAMPK